MKVLSLLILSCAMFTGCKPMELTSEEKAREVARKEITLAKIEREKRHILRSIEAEKIRTLNEIEK